MAIDRNSADLQKLAAQVDIEVGDVVHHVEDVEQRYCVLRRFYRKSEFRAYAVVTGYPRWNFPGEKEIPIAFLRKVDVG